MYRTRSAVETALPALVNAQRAVSVAFMIFGLCMGLWFIHIPVVTARLQMEPGVLGLALLCVGLGAVISQPFAGQVLKKIGSRRAIVLLMPAQVLVFLIPSLASNVATLFVGTLALGMTGGAFNVAVNTQASEIEAARGRPMMSTFHGFFSTGGLLAAVLGGAALGAGLTTGFNLGLFSAILLVLSFGLARYFIVAPPKSASETGSKGFSLSGSALIGLAVLAFFCNSVEGSVNDWSALYLNTIKGTSVATSAMGFALFSFAMAAVRFAGSRLVERLGEKRIVAGGGVLIALGMAIAILSSWPPASIAGFLIVGLGAANTMPLLVGAAGRVPGISASSGIATAATAALLGFLLGPPVIGFVAQQFGLSASLGQIVLVGLMVAFGASMRTWQPIPHAQEVEN